MFQKQISALGLDIPESMKVRLNYGFLPLDQARKVLQQLNRAFKKAQFQDLVAIGIDDSGVEYAFDFDRVYASIEVNAEKDGNGHYSVFSHINKSCLFFLDFFHSNRYTQRCLQTYCQSKSI